MQGVEIPVMRLPMRALISIALPVALLAQGPGPRPRSSWWEGPWWNSRLVEDVNLSEAQKNDIGAVVKDYRDVEAAFDENPVDQRKATDAIERLAGARADLTRTLSQMSLKLRMVLTADQWQELQRRQPRKFDRDRGRGAGSGRPGNARPSFGPPPSSDTKQ